MSWKPNYIKICQTCFCYFKLHFNIRNEILDTFLYNHDIPAAVKLKQANGPNYNCLHSALIAINYAEFYF